MAKNAVITTLRYRFVSQETDSRFGFISKIYISLSGFLIDVVAYGSCKDSDEEGVDSDEVFTISPLVLAFIMLNPSNFSSTCGVGTVCSTGFTSNPPRIAVYKSRSVGFP